MFLILGGWGGGTFLKNLPTIISELLYASHYFSFWKGICVAIILSVIYHWLEDVWVPHWRETSLRPDVVKTIPKWFTFILMLFLKFWVFSPLGRKWMYFVCSGREAEYLNKIWDCINHVLYYSSFIFIWGRVMYPSLLTSGLVLWLAWKIKYEQKLSMLLFCSIFISAMNSPISTDGAFLYLGSWSKDDMQLSATNL